MGTPVVVKEAIKQRRDAGRYAPLRVPHYSHRGDYIAVYFEDIGSYSEVIDDILTLYRSIDSNELVGCKICNVSLLAENISNIFHISDDSITLKLLLLSAAGTKPARRHYYDVSKLVGEMSLPAESLLATA